MFIATQLTKDHGIPALAGALLLFLSIPIVSDISALTTTRQYDGLNRLTNIVSTSGGNASPASAAYLYNLAQQRTRRTEADGSYWNYQYDALGQVTVGTRHAADGSPMPGQQFEFSYDDIGNRRETRTGGNAGGSNLRVSTYTPNLLNQVTQRTVPGFAEVQGRARSDATVTVNLQPATRQGTYWRSELNADNSTAPVLMGITNVAVLRGGGAGGTDLVASNTGTLFLPQTPETYLHDADGNLTRDGRWTNYWDGENRLIRTESLADAPAAPRVRQDWSHLPDGRWAQRIISTWDGSAYAPQSTNRFLWDGQVLLAVLNGNNQTEQAYLRGSDLSGTPQGAGGVGGLLAVSLGTNGTHFACFDGNGNVAALLSANSSTLTATYEYDPFGNTLRATGPAADSNSLRFSTQFADEVTGHVKYLYRDYDAGMGRWMSRDPNGEIGFNLYYDVRHLHDRSELLYEFVNNDPIKHWDYLGLVGLDSPSVTFISAVAQGEWSTAWTLLELEASAVGRSVWVSFYARAVAATTGISMGPALSQQTRAFHIVQPGHQWCRLVSVPQNNFANAVSNFQRIQATIAQAWNQGTIISSTGSGNVVKEAFIQGQRIVINGRVLQNGNGIVEIVDAWVTR